MILWCQPLLCKVLTKHTSTADATQNPLNAHTPASVCQTRRLIEAKEVRGREKSTPPPQKSEQHYFQAWEQETNSGKGLIRGHAFYQGQSLCLSPGLLTSCAQHFLLFLPSSASGGKRLWVKPRSRSHNSQWQEHSQSQLHTRVRKALPECY